MALGHRLSGYSGGCTGWAVAVSLTLATEAWVTQATVNWFGNFSLKYRVKAVQTKVDGTIEVSSSDYRLLFHNHRLLRGRKLNSFDMLGILHRLTIPAFLADDQGKLQRTNTADPREIDAPFLQNVGSQRAASLLQWYVERQPGDFQEIRRRSSVY